jgi:TRAP-type C4-dicarboxylate transport system permease small subunit
MTWLIEKIDQLSRCLMIVAALCAFALMFLIMTDVTARNLNIRFYGVAEYVRATLIIIVFLQLPYAVRIRSMLNVDAFVHLIPERGRVPMDVIGSALAILFFGTIAVGAFHPAVEAWMTQEYEGEGPVRVVTWPSRFAIVFGCGFAAFYYALRIYETLKSGRVAESHVESIT